MLGSLEFLLTIGTPLSGFDAWKMEISKSVDLDVFELAQTQKQLELSAGVSTFLIRNYRPALVWHCDCQFQYQTLIQAC